MEWFICHKVFCGCQYPAVNILYFAEVMVKISLTVVMGTVRDICFSLQFQPSELFSFITLC